MAKKAKTTKELLIQAAEDNNDLKLYRVANNEGDIWGYLEEYIESNNLGEMEFSSVTSRTLKQTFKANKARAKKLQGWIIEEGMVENPTAVEKTILQSYKDEKALLDKYAVLILCDFLGIK